MLESNMKVSDNQLPEDAFSTTEPERYDASNNEISRSISIEDTQVDRIPVGTSTATMTTEKNLEAKQGVTGEPSEPSFTRLGQLGVSALTTRITKMVTVADGPVPSGDVKILLKLNRRGCSDITRSRSLHLTSNRMRWCSSAA